MAETVLAGDQNAGDVIALPDADGQVVVELVRLGPGGFVLTVSAVGAAPAERCVVTLTAATRVNRNGESASLKPAFLQPSRARPARERDDHHAAWPTWSSLQLTGQTDSWHPTG